MTAGTSLPGGPGGPGGPSGPEAPEQADAAGAAGGLGAADELAGTGWRAQGRRAAVVALLAAALIAWAAAPVSGGGAGTRLALIVAVICAVASTGRLAIGEDPIQRGPFDPLHLRLLASVADVMRALPWAEGLIITVLVLEARHGSRPWHTGVLGAALLAYLIAAHLTQARSSPAALAGQLPVIAAGVGLLALAVGAAALPEPHAGPGTELLRILAVLAAVAAGGLALPVSGRRQPPGGRR
jgi:hypothetical protein